MSCLSSIDTALRARCSLLRRLVNSAGQLWDAGRPAVVILLVYVVLTVLMTYPVALQLTTHIAGSGDSFEHLWLLWWGKKAMWDLHTSMANLSYLYAPWGVYHPLLAVTPLVQIVSIPLELLFTPLVTYNLVFLSSFVLTAFTTYLLCYHVTQNRWASFIGGLIYGFAPTRMVHGYGHLAQIITYWFPLYALFAVRLTEHPNWKNGLLTGVFMGLAALVNFVHTANFVLIFTLCWLAYVFFAHRKLALSPQFLKSVVLALVVAAVLAVPFFVPYFASDVSGSVEYIMPGGATRFSVPILGLVLPSPRNPLIRALDLSEQVRELLSYVDVESWAYLGFVPLVLALWGALKNRAVAGLWIVLAVVTIVFSMGPFLKFGPDRVVIDTIDGIDVYVPMPYVLLRLIPIFKASRTPGRISIGTPLALSVLVSLGLVQVESWLMRGRRIWKWLASSLIVAVILFEYCVGWPYPSTPAPVPEFYTQIREDEGDFAVIDYPLNVDFIELVRGLYYQTAHEHPIAGGRTWRRVVDGEAKTVMINDLVAPLSEASKDIFTVERTGAARVEWLVNLGFRYVVLHKYPTSHAGVRPPRPAELVEAERRDFTDLLSNPIYEDDQIIAYRVIAAGDGLQDIRPLTALVDGWNYLEGESGDHPYRWLEQEGIVHAYSPATSTHRLVFDAQAFDHAREFSLLVNDQSVHTTTVDARREFLSPAFTLRPGMNSLVFRANQPCDSPMDLGVSEDTRCLSVLFSQLAWEDADLAYTHPEYQAQFGDKFRLLGYDIDRTEVAPGDVVHLKLYWEMLDTPDRDYTVFTHIWNPELGFAGQQDNEPLFGLYHTSWFGEGEVVEDIYDIIVRDDAALGTYTLQIGWYDPVTGERLPVGEDRDRMALKLARMQVRAMGE